MELDLKLTDEEIERQSGSDYRGGMGELYDRAIADAATAKAVLFFKIGDCWCPKAQDVPYMCDHSPQCKTTQEFLEAQGIQKPQAAP